MIEASNLAGATFLFSGSLVVPKTSTPFMVIAMGGSIDAVDGDSVAHGNLPPPSAQYLLAAGHQFQWKTICQKDSRNITEEDRRQAAEIINFHSSHNAPAYRCHNFIVTHGTFTAPETARYLAAHTRYANIVIAGAERPALLGGVTDATLSLGAAMGILQVTSGFRVHIVSSGSLVQW